MRLDISTINSDVETFANELLPSVVKKCGMKIVNFKSIKPHHRSCIEYITASTRDEQYVWPFMNFVV